MTLPTSEISKFVSRRATALQRDFLSERKSSVARARRDLANLRNAANKSPGTVPAVWELTIQGVPGVPLNDKPSYEEQASHLALTLYAIHQQSRPERMHIPGTGFGQAVASLERRTTSGDSENISPVRRRFNMVAESQTLPELAHHLRSLVGRLHSEGIPLDYGMLADDIWQFQFPGGMNKVKLRWARQYYQLDHETNSPKQEIKDQK